MFQEAFFLNIPTQTLTGGSGTVDTEVNVRTPQFDFEFRKTIHTATDDRIYKKILDGFTGRYLFNGKVDLRAASGKALSGITSYGFLPFLWPVPYVVKANSYVSFFLSDFSTSENTLDLCYHGIGKYANAPTDMKGEPVNFDNEDKRVTVPIIIASASIVAAAGAGNKAEGIATILNDADFVCTKITGISTGDGYVEIWDSNRGVDWQQNKTRISNLVGNGQFPNILPARRFVKANTNLTIRWENNTGSENTLNLYFHGYKRFGMQG